MKMLREGAIERPNPQNAGSQDRQDSGLGRSHRKFQEGTEKQAWVQKCKLGTTRAKYWPLTVAPRLPRLSRRRSESLRHESHAIIKFEHQSQGKICRADFGEPSITRYGRTIDQVGFEAVKARCLCRHREGAPLHRPHLPHCEVARQLISTAS